MDITDPFGYHLTRIPFSYTDISGSGTAISPTAWVGSLDDGYYQLNLPFNFRFYGAPYNKVSITSNGYLQFGSNSAFSGHNPLSVNLVPNNIAAGYWNDLDPSAGGDVKFMIQGSPGTQTVVIQYTNVPSHSAAGSVSFQFVLFEMNNNIEVRYLSTSTHDSGATASAGLRGLFDCPNHTSLPFSYNQAQLTNGLALRYAYPVIEPACGTPTFTPSFTISNTFTPSATISPTFSHSPTASPSFTASPSRTDSPTPTASPSPSNSPSPTVTRTVVAITDAFGYTAASAPYVWTDISGSGTLVTAWAGGADDGSFIYSFPLGMTFRFYGTAYDKVAIASNGYLQFGTSSSDFGNNCLTAPAPPTNIIALFWQDLDPGLGGGVFTQIFGSPGSRMAVIQYENVQKNGGGGAVSAQVLLFEADNSISLRWKDTAGLASGGNAVAGLRSIFDCPNRTSLPLSCNSPVIGSLSAVTISYPAIEPACGTATPTRSFSVTSTFTLSSTISPTFTVSPTQTPTSTITQSFTVSPTFSVSPTISATFSASPSFSVSPTLSPSFSVSPTFSVTDTQTPSSTISPTFSESNTFTQSPTISPTFSESPSFTLSPTPSNSPTISPSFSASPSFTFSPTATPSFTATDTPTRTVSMTWTGSPTRTVSPTPTNTAFPPPTKPACAVLGEPDFTTSSGIAMGAASLSFTSGVALDLSSFPYRLYVADPGHHRILIFNNAGAIANGGPADGVIGQVDFASALANRGGAAGAGTLSSPGGIGVDLSNGDLWVADSGNHRVLRFSAPIALNGALADRVLGQGGNLGSVAPNFGGISAQSLQSPADLSIDSFRQMAVADLGNSRVLRFDLTNATDAAYGQWGQATFNDALVNRGGSTGQNTLNNPAGVLLTANNLWVSDTGNHRILRYELTIVSPTASAVLGQTNYSNNLGNFGFANPGPNTLRTPMGLGLDSAQRLYVADSGNHRVIAYDPPYGGTAALVYGQAGLFSAVAGVGNDSMNAPKALRADAAGNLLVTDSQNHRLLFYGCNSGVGAATPTPTRTASPTRTATKTESPTLSPTFTISPTFSDSPTPTETPSITFSPTHSATLTVSPSFTLTRSPSPSFTVSATPSISRTVTQTQTPFLAATLTPYPQPKDFVVSYPNPALRSAGGACLAYPRGSRVEATIYDMLLQEVRKLDSISAGAGVMCWNLKNNSGLLIAPGIYYIRVLVDGKTYMAKMTVI